MASSSPARLLAPLALVAFALAFLIVLTTSGGGEDEPDRADRAPARERAANREQTRSANTADGVGSPNDTEGAPRPTGPRFYRIRPGDILSSISEEFGVPVARLQELNPDIDPQSLVTGQRIRLRR